MIHILSEVFILNSNKINPTSNQKASDHDGDWLHFYIDNDSYDKSIFSVRILDSRS